jgi:hypothetical protein
MTREEIATLIEQMPQGMDANEFLIELVNRALNAERKWVSLTDTEMCECYNSTSVGYAIEAKLKEKNT